VTFAYEAAKAGHAKQFRRDGITRYFDHPKRAAWIYIDELNGFDMEVVINILLHDIGEDSYLLSYYRMKLNFGKNRMLDHFAVTKMAKGKESTIEYLQRIVERGPRAIVTKLCDRLDNLRDILSCTQSEIQKSIIETEKYHVPILIKALNKCGGEWSEITSLLAEKISSALIVAKERVVKLQSV
jgi:(p)ppGpp synthase/HD superfamily hydrolase